MFSRLALEFPSAKTCCAGTVKGGGKSIRQLCHLHNCHRSPQIQFLTKKRIHFRRNTASYNKSKGAVFCSQSDIHVGTSRRQEAYKLLGLKGDESASEIKVAFRRIALRYHPDVCHQADGAEKFVKLKKAYMFLVRHICSHDNLDADMDDDKDGDLDWADHDWAWAWKYEKVGSKKSRSQNLAEVRSQLEGLHSRARRKASNHQTVSVPYVENAGQDDSSSPQPGSIPKLGHNFRSAGASIPKVNASFKKRAEESASQETASTTGATVPKIGSSFRRDSNADHIPKVEANFRRTVTTNQNATPRNSSDDVEAEGSQRGVAATSTVLKAEPSFRTEDDKEEVRHHGEANENFGGKFSNFSTGHEREEVMNGGQHQSGAGIPKVGASFRAAVAEEEDEVSEDKGEFRAGPHSNQSSTPEAHQRLGKQLQGLKRKSKMRRRKRGGTGANDATNYNSDWSSSMLPITELHLNELPDPVFHAEAHDEMEKRFLRLARLAQEWRHQRIRTYVAQQPHFGELTFCSIDDMNSDSDEEYTSPRHALLASVQAVAIGGGFDE